MKLILYRDDLREEEKNRSLTRFEHFTDKVQAAIRIIGHATFREYNHSSYNVIIPPIKARNISRVKAYFMTTSRHQ